MVKVLEGIKWICFAGLIFLAGSLLFSGKASQADFNDVKAAVTESASLDEVLEGENLMIKKLYGIEPSGYDGITLLYPTTNMGARELLLVKLKEGESGDEVLEAIQDRIDKQKNSFDGYGIEQMGLLEHAVIENRGGYILFVVADDSQKVKETFIDAL